ncbi:hypothetical protein KBA27_05470 [bacterium]|nr:hypothetical protein [bacterium]
MFKKIFLIFAIATFLIGTSLICTSCKRPITTLLFNDSPITKETILNYSRNFYTGQKIYFIFISEKPIVADRVRIQIYKYNDPGNMLTDLVYGIDHKVHLDEYYYVTDYVVLHQAGHYMMQIFARDQLYEALTGSDFYVKDR